MSPRPSVVAIQHRINVREHIDPQLNVRALKSSDSLGLSAREIGEISVLHANEIGTREGEVGVKGEQSIKGNAWRTRETDLTSPLFEKVRTDIDQHLGKHGVFAWEVLVEPRTTDANCRTEIFDGHTVKPSLGEETSGGREKLLAARRRVSAGSRRENFRHSHLLDVEVNER